MKVVVGKMPGGRATEVEIPEGGTVLDAIKAAGYESDLNQGFEARLNNSQTELSSAVSANSIITLTSKITGNGISAISVVPVDTGKACEKFVVLTPTIIHDFINIPDVKEMLLRLKNTVLSSPIKCIIADSENLKVSKPAEVLVVGETVICADTSYAIQAGNYVVFCNDTVAEKINTMDYLSAVTYIESYLPDEDKNPNSLAASAIPEEVKEIQVEETEGQNDGSECCEEDYTCDKNCESCEEKSDCSEATEYEGHCKDKESNSCCDPSQCCEDCESDTCGGCDCGDCCEEDEDCLPEHILTISDMVSMCRRLNIDINIIIPGVSR